MVPESEWSFFSETSSKVIEEMEGYNVVSCNACLFYNSPIGTLVNLERSEVGS